MAIASRSQEKVEEAAAEIDGDVAAVRRRRLRPRSHRRAPSRGREAPRPDRDPRRQHRRAAVRRRPRPRGRGVGAGLPLTGPRAGDPRQGRRPRDARARLGPDRQRRLDLDPRADPRPQSLQLPPDGGDRVPEDALASRSPATGSPSTRSSPAASRPSASPTQDGSLEGAEEAARTQVPGGPARGPGGVRRPGRLPLLRARRLHHRDDDPDRRRRPPLVLLGATDVPLPPRPHPRGQRRRRPRQALDRAGADPRPDGGRGGRRVHRQLARAPLRRRPHAHRRGRDRALPPRPAAEPAPARRRDDLRPQTGRDPLRPGQRGDAPGPRRR